MRAAIAFGVTLALVIGLRLERGALAAVVGVACGIGSSIPMGILIVLLLRRRDRSHSHRDMEARGLPTVRSAPVIIVSPPNLQQLPYLTGRPAVNARNGSSGREFTVIGEEGIETGFDG